MSALQDAEAWAVRAEQGKTLLQRLARSKQHYRDIASQYSIRPHGNNYDWVTDSVPHGQHASSSNQTLPDHVMVALLEREKLLTQGKAHVSSFKAMMGERELRHLQSMI
ncbi:TPA: hypothetical protein ACH3X3_006341 [Trebouxia sp. C0006]